MAGTIRIKQIALKIGSGKTPQGGGEAYVTEGVTFIRSQNVHFDGLRLDDVVFIDAETDATMRSTRVRPEDVLLNITGASLGRAAIVPNDLGPANVNQHVCIIRPSGRVVPKFLLWCLQSHPIQARIFELQVGGNRDGLNFEQVGDLAIPYPSLDAQNAIANYLDCEIPHIDTLIAAKQQMISLLTERWWEILDTVIWGNTKRATRLMNLVDLNRQIMYGIILPGPDVHPTPRTLGVWSFLGF